MGGFEIDSDDIVVTRSPREGTVVETDGELAVALDTRIDDSLRAEGWARDFVSRVQQRRREADLDVSDRIHLQWSTANTELADALTRHEGYIRSETLAVSSERADSLTARPDAIDGQAVTIEIERAN